MEIKISIECSAKEARQFFGMPDVEPLNDAMVAKVQERLEKGIDSLSPENIVQTWMGGMLNTAKGVGEAQKMFMSALGRGKNKDEKTKKSTRTRAKK